jgi:hypothetical protein
MVIRLLLLLGMVWNVAAPPPAFKAKFNSRHAPLPE